MKPIISDTDYKVLQGIIERANFKSEEMEKLEAELERAEKVNDNEFVKDIIKLNSRFEVEDIETNRVRELTLTLPHQANIKKQKLSIFSPLGVALIGSRKGAIVEWGGMKTCKILNVVNE